MQTTNCFVPVLQTLHWIVRLLSTSRVRKITSGCILLARELRLQTPNTSATLQWRSENICTLDIISHRGYRLQSCCSSSWPLLPHLSMPQRLKQIPQRNPISVQSTRSSRHFTSLFPSLRGRRRIGPASGICLLRRQALA